MQKQAGGTQFLAFLFVALVMLDRDASLASVMQNEVLSKHRKALMLFGDFHLFHRNVSAPKGLESAV